MIDFEMRAVHLVARFRAVTSEVLAAPEGDPMGEHGAPISGESIYGDEEGAGKGVVRISAVAALGGFLFGYDSAVINGAGCHRGYFQADPASLGFAVASALLGAAVGALLAGRIADHLGRLSVMKIAALLFFVSAIGTAWSPELWVLIVFRVVGGLGVGVASVIAPAYIAEIAPARIRGRLASLQQLAIVTGIFISLLVDFIFVQSAGGAGEPLWFGWEAWQLDVPGDGHPGRHLRRAGVHHPGVAAASSSPTTGSPRPRRSSPTSSAP